MAVGNEETRSVATTEKIPHTQNPQSGFTGQYTIGSLICYDGMLRENTRNKGKVKIIVMSHLLCIASCSL